MMENNFEERLRILSEIRTKIKELGFNLDLYGEYGYTTEDGLTLEYGYYKEEDVVGYEVFIGKHIDEFMKSLSFMETETEIDQLKPNPKHRRYWNPMFDIEVDFKYY